MTCKKAPKISKLSSVREKLDETDIAQAWGIQSWLDDAEKYLGALRRAMDNTLNNMYFAQMKGEEFFIVGTGPVMWWVAEKYGIVDGPMTKQEAFDLAAEMNKTLKESRS